MGDWLNHLFGPCFKFSFLFENQIPYSLISLGNNKLFLYVDKLQELGLSATQLMGRTETEQSKSSEQYAFLFCSHSIERALFP